jgi:hypothetical protein
VCVDGMIVHTVRYCSPLGCVGSFLSACVTVDSTAGHSPRYRAIRVVSMNTLIQADVEIRVDIQLI